MTIHAEVGYDCWCLYLRMIIQAYHNLSKYHRLWTSKIQLRLDYSFTWKCVARRDESAACSTIALEEVIGRKKIVCMTLVEG